MFKEAFNNCNSFASKNHPLNSYLPIILFLLQRELTKHVASRAVGLVIFPGILYLLQFYVMFAVLQKSGPHDDMMSSAFQASLEVVGVMYNTIK